MSNLPQLEATYVLEYTYKRSVGPVMSRFFTGLRDGKIEGARAPGGKVVVPPTEYDPDTGESVTEWVPVGTSGTVKTWAWVSEPRPVHPLQKPFAWALIQLDGADTSMLHAVDAGEMHSIKTGSRVRVRWATERVGSIKDIECFELEPDPGAGHG